MKPSNRKKSKRPHLPPLPELDQTKRSVLNSLASVQSRRSYQHPMDEFIDWYCSEPRLALNRGVVLRYRINWKLSNLHQRPSAYDSLAAQRLRIPVENSPSASKALVARADFI